VRVALVSNVSNGKGLQRDVEILTPILESAGCIVSAIDFQKATTPRRGAFDLCIFLEVAPERFFECSASRWLIPNPEWWETSASLAPFDRVLCKTADAERLFRQRPDGGRARYIGFESQSRRTIADPWAAIATRPGRKLGFLHIAGGSTAKGTQAVLDAWAGGIPHPLTVVTSVPGSFNIPKCSTLTMLTGRIPDHRLAELQRSIPVHLQPSEYEGFGHCIHEGLGVGACVVTTDAAPMNGVDGIADTVAVSRTWPMKSARAWGVSADAVAATVARVAAQPADWFESVRVDAIRAFEAQRAAFRETLAWEVGR